MIVLDRPCPICDRPGRFLAGPSEGASVDYYRCDPCGHVWSHDKLNPDAPAVPVTKPPSLSRADKVEISSDSLSTVQLNHDSSASKGW